MAFTVRRPLRLTLPFACCVGALWAVPWRAPWGLSHPGNSTVGMRFGSVARAGTSGRFRHFARAFHVNVFLQTGMAPMSAFMAFAPHHMQTVIFLIVPTVHCQ